MTDARKLANRMQFGIPEESSLGKWIVFRIQNMSNADNSQYMFLLYSLYSETFENAIGGLCFVGCYFVTRGWSWGRVWDAWSGRKWEAAGISNSEQTCGKSCKEVCV